MVCDDAVATSTATATTAMPQKGLQHREMEVRRINQANFETVIILIRISSYLPEKYTNIAIGSFKINGPRQNI